MANVGNFVGLEVVEPISREAEGVDVEVEETVEETAAAVA